MSPKLSVCIPAYNRPNDIVELLRSIAQQGFGDWDVVICEDNSPNGVEIAEAVREFSREHPKLLIHYWSNKKNLEYDGNLRNLLNKTDGGYCLFMGDDDAVACPNVGFVLRAWKSVDKEAGKNIQMHRYFSGDRLFPPGKESIAALYRRSVFISGLTVHRQTTKNYHTNRFDGMLLYQLFLVARILTQSSGYYVSDIVVLSCIGGEHYFGSSEVEKGRFYPKQLHPSYSVTFLKGLFDIARVLDREVCPGVFDLITQDLSRYSYRCWRFKHRSSAKESPVNMRTNWLV